MRAVGAHQQRVAVRRGACGFGRADVAPCAGAVFHDEGLPQGPGQILGQIAAGDVGALAGLIGDDQLDGFGGVAVCRRGRLREQQGCR
ncbi:hypothetical protein D3C71_1725640 [compost metagenome]